jgi:hypothetical protein
MAKLTFETGRGIESVFIEPETLERIVSAARNNLGHLKKVEESSFPAKDAHALSRLADIDWRFFQNPKRNC